MAVVLFRGQVLTKDDLNIFITDNGNPISPASITYTIWRSSRTFYNKRCIGEEPILETINSIACPFGIGKFFAPWVMPKDIEIGGGYRIKWNFRKTFDSPIIEEPEEFCIIVDSCLSTDANGYVNGGVGNLPHNRFVGVDPC